MRNLLETKEIYSNKKLQDFILNLEIKYRIEDLSEKYSNLVNFSQNTDVPFHKWFRYREGFSGELIKELIKLSGASKDDVIVDPFSGSGTTPVVAVQEGYTGMGIDVNPLSAFIASVKVRKFNKRDIKEVQSVLQNMDNMIISKSDKYPDIKKYFTESNFNQLVSIKEIIDRVENVNVHDILKVGFLSIIEESSNRRRDGNGLKTVQTKVNDVKEYFYNKMSDILSDIKSLLLNKDIGEGISIAASATELHKYYQEHIAKQDKKIGTIIFSPPYANSFDYFESYKLELVFGDFTENIKGIKEFREQAVRSFIGGKDQENTDTYVDLIADEILKSVPEKERETGRRDLRTRKVPSMIKGYFEDMRIILEQCYKSIEVGTKIYIVVDQSAYVGVIVPTDLILAYLGEELGYKVDNIIKCRNCRTSAQQIKRFPYLKDNLRESIVVLERI